MEAPRGSETDSEGEAEVLTKEETRVEVDVGRELEKWADWESVPDTPPAWAIGAKIFVEVYAQDNTLTEKCREIYRASLRQPCR